MHYQITELDTIIDDEIKKKGFFNYTLKKSFVIE